MSLKRARDPSRLLNLLDPLNVSFLLSSATALTLPLQTGQQGHSTLSFGLASKQPSQPAEMSTLQDQLAEVRAARAQHYREHKVTEAVQATKDARVERERQESGGSSMSGSGSANGNGNGVAGLSRKRESRADSSDDEEIEWIEGPVSKKAAMGNGNGHVSGVSR